MLIKAKKLIPKVAKELSIPEELIEDVINFYYKSVRQKVEKLSTHRIRITGLGVLHIRPAKLKLSIIKITASLTSTNPKSFRNVIQKQILQEALDEQNIFISKLIENGFISNLEEQSVNPRGDKK